MSYRRVFALCPNYRIKIRVHVRSYERIRDWLALIWTWSTPWVKGLNMSECWHSNNTYVIVWLCPSPLCDTVTQSQVESKWSLVLYTYVCVYSWKGPVCLLTCSDQYSYFGPLFSVLHQLVLLLTPTVVGLIFYRECGVWCLGTVHNHMTWAPLSIKILRIP